MSGDDEQTTSLMHAARRGDLPEVQRLATLLGVDKVDWDGWTALHYAARKGHVPVIEWLCQKGANVNSLTSGKVTPLMRAAWDDHASAVSTLLSLGADPTATNIFKETALGYARSENHTNVIRVLEEWGNFSKQKVELVGSTPRQRRHYARTNCMRILSAGKRGNGKSTLLNTLLSSKSSLTDKSDRTEVANFGIWVPDGRKMKVISTVDLGGHDSYQATGHYFHRNGLANVVVLCHEISSTEYDDTFNWVESIIYTSPSSHIEFILTKADLIDNEEDRQQKKEAFLKELELYLKDQCELLKDAVLYAQQHKLDEDHRKSIEEAQRKYEMLCDNKDSCTHLISCVEGYDSTVDQVRERLLELSERPGTMVYLEESHQRLYEDLGKVGLDVPQMIQADSSLSAAAKPKSSKKPLYKKIWHKVRRKKVTEEDKVEALSPQTSSMQQTQYATLDEAVAVFKTILQELGLTTAAVQEQTKQALAKLSDHGFIIYFKDSERLSNVVFNDLKTFVDVLKCIFHHRINEFLEYDANDELVKKNFGLENTEKHFHGEIKKLRDNATMTNKLLQFLLDKSNCAIDSNTVMELLNKVDVGYLFRPKQITECTSVSVDSSDPVVFIPYFLKEKEQEDVDLTLFQNIEKCDVDQLSLTVLMTGRVKKPFFDYLVVRLYERLYPYQETQKLILHRHGFYATLGKYNICMALTMPRKGEIKFVVKGSVKTLEGHRTIFEFFKYFDEDSTLGMRTWWRGMPGKKVFICTNCSMMELKCERCVSDVLKHTQHNQRIFCEGSYNDIPAALVFPLSENVDEANEQLGHLREYLRLQFKRIQVYPHTEGVQGSAQSGRQDTNPRVSGASTEQEIADSITHSTEATKLTSSCQGVESVERGGDTAESTSQQVFTGFDHIQRMIDDSTTGLSQQMSHHGKVISDQMSTQDGELSGCISKKVDLQHSALRACQEGLVKNMKTNEKLLDGCASLGILGESDISDFLDDQNLFGRANRLLKKVKDYGNNGPQKLSEALQMSGDGNKILGEQLSRELCRINCHSSVR